MSITGTVHCYGDDVNIDEIISARYLNTIDEQELASYCMEDIDADFPKKVRAGDVIVAGKNFGCGSSREHAPIAIKAAKVSCVIAATYARIFYRNAINIGLPILECPEAAAAIKAGDSVAVDLAAGRITVQNTGATFQAQPFPEFMRELIAAGGLIPYVMAQRAKTA